MLGVGMELQLRDYQIEVAELARQAFRAKNRSVLIVLPCGAGKTVLFAYIAQQAQNKGNKVLFLVHRVELLDQTIATFNKFGIERKVIDIEMVQTTANKYKKIIDKNNTKNGAENDIETITDYDLIIFDEAHHSTSKTWRTIIDNQPKAKIVGLTATPCRLDGKPLGDIYNHLIVGISANSLIQRDFLSQYDYFAPTVADLSELRKRGSDYDMGSAEELLDTPAIFGDIIHHFKRLASNMQTICYCPTRAYSKKTAQLFNDNGIKAVHFDGETPKNERNQIIKDFRDKKIQVLCNVDLISEGFDVPDCHCCILLRPTQSSALFIQQATRALRPAPNKKAVIIDHVGNYLRHGFPTQDRQWSLDKPLEKHKESNEKGELKIRQCLVCFGTFPTAPVCPYCGTPYENTKEELANIEKIELKRIKEEEALRARQLREQKRAEKQAEAEKKQRMDEGVARRVKDYTSADQCKSRYELSIWCKINGIPQKQYISMCFKRGFLKRK